MTIVIMGMEAKEVPVKPKEIEFDKDGRSFKYVDKDGKVIKKLQVQASEYVWKYEDGTEFSGKEYKSLNGKPVKPLDKTSIIKDTEIISRDEMKYFLENPYSYVLVGEEFKNKLKELSADNKAISFKYVVRAGFKVYRAVAYYDIEIDKSVLKCFRGDIRKAELNDVENKTSVEVDDNVETIDLDAMEV